jgi:hypothetical protein
MTATTIPASWAPARRRPVPWARLARVTWRQHWPALAGVTALLGAIALYLLIMGLQIHHAYAALVGCHPAASASCRQLALDLNGYYGSQSGAVLASGLNAQTVSFLLLAVPVLLGVFTGAPVLARELETGTFRFAWTQGAGRLRWTITKLVLLAAALTAAAWAFSMLYSWYYQPFLAEGKTTRFPLQVFGNMGVSFAAWTLFAFALAAFAGAVIRRTMAAIAASLAVWTVLDLTTIMSLRQHYQAPVTTIGSAPDGSWALSNWFTGPGGKPVSSGTIASLLQQVPAGPRAQNALATLLSQHHYTSWFSYQPASRFWTFQLIEGGGLLALSLALFAATVYLVRRRAA